MSQEEEKLIEEFWKMMEDNQFVKSTDSITDQVKEFPLAIIDMESTVKIDGEFDKYAIEEWVLSAYRAGKLAEIIAFEKLIPEKRKKYFSERNGYMKETFSDGYNEVVDEFKSLIEEEKKKL